MDGAFDFDTLFRRLLNQESGNRNILGPLITAGENAGDRAFGPAQVMPKTAADPGFGVRAFDPNAADPVAENRRFGKDYLDAMLKRYGGDQEAALVAYNAGPGNADEFVKAGSDYGVLPKRSETEPYVRNIMGKGGGKAMDTGGAFDAPAQEPWMEAFAKSEESKTPLGQFLTQMIGERKKDLATTGTGDTWQEKLSSALYHGGIGLLKAGGRKGVSTAQAIGEGLGGAAEGLEKLKTEGKSRKKTAEGSLRELQLQAAKLASPSLSKSGRRMDMKDLMQLVKDSNAGILDPGALRKSAIQYGHNIKDDQFGSAYLQNTLKELAGKAEKGELTDEEKADLEALTDIFKDVGR